jgi:hypothetical protein
MKSLENKQSEVFSIHTNFCMTQLQDTPQSVTSLQQIQVAHCLKGLERLESAHGRLLLENDHLIVVVVHHR